jgi:stage V sporulation protein SpoVS
MTEDNGINKVVNEASENEIEQIEQIEQVEQVEQVEHLVQDEHKIKLDEQTIKESVLDGQPIENLKVAADPQDISPEERKRNVKKLAGAISHSLRTKGEISVRAFGNAAIGKACKALAIAKSYVDDTNKLQLAYAPKFITTQMGENTLTGIGFVTFASEKKELIDLSKVNSVLMVKADPKDISPIDRRSAVRKLAGAISHAVEENKNCLVRCFGNAAIGKACKALAIARGFTATRGCDLYCWDDFIVTKMGDNERTGIAFFCFSNEV